MLWLVGLLAVLTAYFLLLGLLWMQQERVVFQPPGVSRRAAWKDALSPNVRQVSYRADDGTELFAFLVGDVSSAKRIMLAFHGNADLARNLIPWAQGVARQSHSAVLLPEIRGYDRLPGRPTYLGVARDARAARRFVTDELHFSDERIVLFGHSLGSAIATELAAEAEPIALLLQSPFTSARDMARRMRVPGLTMFWPVISRVHYDTSQRVRSLRAPVSVAHGLRDFIVPVQMGREVYDAAAVKGALLLVPEAGHNDVVERAPEDYWNWLRSALEGVSLNGSGARTEA